MASEYAPTTDFLQDFAGDAIRVAENQARRIAANNKPSLKDSEHGVKPTAPSLGSKTALSDWLGDPDNMDEAEQVRLESLTQSWLEDYFPQLTGDLQGVPEDWLISILGGGDPYGGASDAIEGVWEQARDRANSAARTNLDTVAAEFSGNGFSLPPGAYVSAVIETRQRANRETNEVATQIAMKDAELRVQVQMKAAEIAAQLKMGIMGSLADFWKLWSDVPDKNNERQRMHIQAMAGLQSSLQAYHQVELAFQELRLRAEEGRTGQTNNIDRNQIALFDSGNANPALGQAVRGFADIASSASNAAGTLVAQIEAI